MIFNNPKEILNAYNNGFVGAKCDKEGLKSLLAKSAHPLFGVSAHGLRGDGEGKLSLLFKSLLKFDPGFGPAEAQKTGDCQNGSDLVQMSDGSLEQIKDIDVGDYVISANGNKRRVTGTIKKEYSGKMVELSLKNHTKVSSTPDHKYIVDNKTMRMEPIVSLNVGDSVFMPKINHIEDKKIDSKTTIGKMVEIVDINIVDPEDKYVYCIEVDTDHNFICNGIGISNCVSHAVRNAIDGTRAVEIDINGEPEAFIARGATEGIYQSRGHRGQGMSCAGAAEYVTGKGGILLRKKYSGADLSVYNSSLGANLRLPNSVFLDEANKHTVRTVSLIGSVEEARDAIANGYALSCCSGYGFSSARDKNGIAKQTGSWSHAMCYHPETEILTERGWIFVNEMSIDDTFATLNQDTHDLEWQKANDILEFDFDGELYNFKRRSLDILVTPEHRMYGIKSCRYIENNSPDNYEFIEAENCSKSFYTKLTCNNSDNQHIMSHKLKNGNVTDMNNWLEFLGYFISEGCTVKFDSKIIRKDRPNNPYIRKVRRVEISQRKEENLPIIQKCLDNLPFNFRRIKDKWVCEQKDLCEELLFLGKSYNKHIPDYVWECGRDQLKIILSALMLGDGSCKDNGDYLNYSTVSKRLSDDFQILLLKTGFSCKITRNKPHEKSFGVRDIYDINIRLSIEHVSLGDAKYVEYKGKVYCPSTDNGIVFVRRDGKASWCGNCWIAADDTREIYDETLFLIQNSWGRWNGGPKRHGQPDGSFWIRESAARRIIASNGSFAFSNVDGFPAKQLPSYGIGEWI